MSRILPILLAGLLATWLPSASRPQLFATEDDSPAVDFRRDIRPILEKKCFRCHDAKKKDGGLDMTSRAGLLQGGSSGAAIVPGNVEKSLMMELIEFEEMPPRKEKQPVTKEEFAKLAAWIKAQAPYPEEKE
jgi:uncharacterized membrane protein